MDLSQHLSIFRCFSLNQIPYFTKGAEKQNRHSNIQTSSSGSCKASTGYAVDATNKGGDALLTQLHLGKPLAGRLLYQDLGYPEAI